MTMRSLDLLNDFTEFCQDNPEMHFWQALRNWSGFTYILAGNRVTDLGDVRDTHYWEARNGLRRSVDAK